MSEQSAATPQVGPEPATPSRKHRFLVAILVVLGSLLLFVSVLAVWVKATLLDTDRWVDTSSQLLENEEIRAALGPYLADQVFSSVDVAAQLEEALPSNLDALAVPLASGLQQLAERRSVVFLGRPRVQEAWREANRVAHTQFVKLVEDKGEFVSTSGGVVTLDLRALVEQLAQQTGVGQRVLERIPEGAGQVTILESDRLESVQRLVRVLDVMGTWLWVIALGVFVLAGYLARGFRLKALRWTSFGFLTVGLLILIALRIGGTQLVNALITDPEIRPAGKAAWGITIAGLRDTARTVLGIGAIALVAAWLAGRGKHAVSVRRWSAPWMREHPGLLWGGFGLVFLLVFLLSPTRASGNLLSMLVLLAFAALGLEVLRRQTLTEFPAATGGESPSAGASLEAGTPAPVPGVRDKTTED